MLTKISGFWHIHNETGWNSLPVDTDWDFQVLFDKGRSQRGGHGWMSPRHGLKRFFSPWITDRWPLCNWCHTPDVAKTKGKCAISTLIFRKFSGAMPPDPHTGEGLRRPSPNPTSLVASRLRASLGTFGPSIVVSPLTKILATRLQRKRERELFETDNQACTGRVTFCYSTHKFKHCYSLTSWTTELWSVTLKGHASVDIEFGCVHKLYPLNRIVRKLVTETGLIFCHTVWAVRSAITATACLLTQIPAMLESSSATMWVVNQQFFRYQTS